MAEKGLTTLFYSVAGMGVILALVYKLGLKSLLLYIAVGLIGFTLGLGIILCSGNRKKSIPKQQPPVGFNILVTKVMEVIKKKKRRVRKVVVSRSVDKGVKEVFDLVVKDFIISWYRDIGKDEDMFLDALEEDVWEFVDNLHQRLKSIDKVQLLTSDVVLKILEHFQKLKETVYIEGEEPKPFYLHPCLATEATETEFLREAVEVLLVLLLPERLAGCHTARHLLREAFTCTVFRPAVDTICDPHYINETFLSYLDYQVQLAERHKKKYAYAASYEDFIKMIGECNDIDELLQMRYHILTEIMHATILDELKKTRKLEADKIPKGNTKSDLLRARNLKRYINQCKVAKTHCEKRVQHLGGADYTSYFMTSSTETEPKPHQRLLSLDEILADNTGRDLLKTFLCKEGKEDLLYFWVSVESMKTCKKPQDQHMKATDIYQTFIGSKSIIDVDKKLTKDMKEFLVSNKGPEAFYEAQTQVYQSLDEEHYPQFLVSETYEQLMEKPGIEDDDSEIATGSEITQNFDPDAGDGIDSSSEQSMQDQSDRIEATLMQLEDTLKQKMQALVNLKKSQSADSKMQESLEMEIEDLKNEKMSLELYIERIDVWWEHVGKWRTDVCLPEIPKDLENFILHFKLVIHPTDPAITTYGWVVLRRLEDFHLLQDRLKDCSKWVKKAKLPSVSKRASRSIDQKELEKMKDSLQRFLSAVLHDETLRQSEALFSLIIPTPKLLKDAPPVAQKRSLFSLSSIFKSSVLRQEDEADEEDDGSSDRKDSIAIPIYELISEIFELHGTFKWLRRSLIIFVQATFGGTINKEVQKGIDWIFSEPLLLYYMKMFRDSMWPGGEWKGNVRGSPSEEVVVETRKKARQKFLKNLPDFLQNLLGRKNCRLGALKIFDAFQDSRTNKHIFYTILEVFLIHLCPELRDPKLLKKLEEQDQRKLKSKLTSQRREEDVSSEDKSSPSSTDSSPGMEDEAGVKKEEVAQIENFGIREKYVGEEVETRIGEDRIKKITAETLRRLTESL